MHRETLLSKLLMNGVKATWHQWLWALWLILIGTVVPLAYFNVPSHLWHPETIGLIAVNENLKFIALLWSVTPGILLFAVLFLLGKNVHDMPKGVLWPSFMLLVGCAGSTLFCIDPERGWLTALEVFIAPMAVFLILSAQRWTPGSISTIMLGWLPAGILVALVGIAQFYHWNAWDPPTQDISPFSFIQEWVQSWVQHFGSWAQSFPRYGLGSMFYSPNLAAEYLVLLIPLSLSGAAIIGRKSIFLSVLLLAVSATLLLFVILAKGRTAWVGLLGGAGLAFIMTLWVVFKARKAPTTIREIKKILFGFIALSSAFFFLLFLSPRWATGEGDDLPGPTPPLQSNRFIKEFTSIFNAESNGRFGIWKDTLTMIKKEVDLFGMGAGHFRIHFPQYYEKSSALFDESIKGPVFKQTRRVHNDYLQLWVEFGLIGIVAWFWLVGRVIKGAYHTMKRSFESEDWKAAFCVIGLLSSLLVFLVSMFFDFPGRMPATLSIGWILMGLLLGMESRNTEHQKPIKSAHITQPLVLLVSLIFSVILLETGWRIFEGDFYRVQANQAYRRHDWDNAKEFTQKAAERLPWDEDVQFKLYHLYSREMDMESALSVVQNHLERNPWYYPSMRNEIDCLEQLGKYAEARESARRILETFPSHPYAAWFRQYVGE